MLDTSIVVYFLEERERIRQKRALGLPAPWTKDQIFIDWSFTNVRREDDRTSRWVATYWREPNRDHPDLNFLMVLACFINNIGTMEDLGCMLPWPPGRFLAVMKDRAQRGERVYGPAYMIRADKRYATTAEYQAVHIFNSLWTAREYMRPRKDETLNGYGSRLGEHHGFRGGFYTGQVIAALKYAPPLLHAPDWSTYVISGPGSRRGLNRVYGHPPDRTWSSEASWLAAFNRLRAAVQPDLERLGLGDLHAQDLQSVLCETDKYLRVLNGEGKPRRRFQPSPDPLPGSGRAEAAE